MAIFVISYLTIRLRTVKTWVEKLKLQTELPTNPPQPSWLAPQQVWVFFGHGLLYHSFLVQSLYLTNLPFSEDWGFFVVKTQTNKSFKHKNRLLTQGMSKYSIYTHRQPSKEPVLSCICRHFGTAACVVPESYNSERLQNCTNSVFILWTVFPCMCEHISVNCCTYCASYFSSKT